MRYDIAVSRYANNKKHVWGSVSVIFDDNIKVENIKILRGKDALLYVAMPRYKNKDGYYKDYCFPITKEFREELYGNILKAYENTGVARTRSYQFNIDDKEGVEYSAKAYKVEDPQSATKGIGTIVMDNCFAFSGITVRKYSEPEIDPETGKEKECYVAYPSYPSGQFTKDGKQIYKNHFFPVNSPTRKTLSDIMMHAYEEAVRGLAQAKKEKPPEKKVEKIR